MASVHIVGELLGASGLSCHEENEAFSVSHVLDMLSLHPSSEWNFFCKWRLVVEDPIDPASNEASWKVIQDLYRQSRETQEHLLMPKMDTVWAHPIELHVATASREAWSCWPRLEFQVWSLDGFQLETLRGIASIPLPMMTNEYVVDVPLVLHEPQTMLASVARAVGLPFQEGRDSVSDKVVRGTGTLYLRLGVLARGLDTITV